MKTIEAKEIEFFKNLSQLELDNLFYDFHNDFDCIKVFFESNTLTLFFRNITNGDTLFFKFDTITLVRFEFFNFGELKKMTIDNIYRGRFERDDELLEIDIDGKSYFYIEFYEGPKIELLCKSIIIGEVEE